MNQVDKKSSLRLFI